MERKKREILILPSRERVSVNVFAGARYRFAWYFNLESQHFHINIYKSRDVDSSNLPQHTYMKYRLLSNTTSKHTPINFRSSSSGQFQ